jgi:superfamily II DNA helicase RecQ
MDYLKFNKKVAVLCTSINLARNLAEHLKNENVKTLIYHGEDTIIEECHG